MGRGEIIDMAGVPISLRSMPENTDGEMLVYIGQPSQFVELVIRETALESAMAAWFTARPDSLEKVLNEVKKGGGK